MSQEEKGQNFNDDWDDYEEEEDEMGDDSNVHKDFEVATQKETKAKKYTSLTELIGDQKINKNREKTAKEKASKNKDQNNFYNHNFRNTKKNINNDRAYNMGNNNKYNRGYKNDYSGSYNSYNKPSFTNKSNKNINNDVVNKDLQKESKYTYNREIGNYGNNSSHADSTFKKRTFTGKINTSNENTGNKSTQMFNEYENNIKNSTKNDEKTDENEANSNKIFTNSRLGKEESAGHFVDLGQDKGLLAEKFRKQEEERKEEKEEKIEKRVFKPQKNSDYYKSQNNNYSKHVKYYKNNHKSNYIDNGKNNETKEKAVENVEKNGGMGVYKVTTNAKCLKDLFDD